MRIRNNTKMGEGLQCCNVPLGRSAMKGGRSATWGKVCNVADLPGLGLQFC